MLSEAIGGLLPAAVGIALSPFQIIAVIVMLGTPRARSNGLAFCVGWVMGLVMVSVIVLAVAGGVAEPDSSAATTVGWLRVAIGALFVILAARQWRKRPRGNEDPPMPSWMSAIDAFNAPRALGLGLLLSAANPKNLALTAAGAAAIAQSGTSGSQTIVAVAVFVAVASISVVGPVVSHLVAPSATARPLASVKEFMLANNAAIVMVVLLVLGVMLLGQGLGT